MMIWPCPGTGTGTVTGFADARGGFLPMVTTMNAAGILDLQARWLGVDHDVLADLALESAPGAGGVTVLLNTMKAIALSGANDRTGAASTLLGVLAGLLLAGAAAVAITWWLRVRLFLVLPAASLERLSGFAPVRRSWRVTSGASGEIFAALLVVGLAEGAANGLAGQAGVVLLTPSIGSGTFGGLVTLVSELLPSVAVVAAVIAVTTAFVFPFLTVMSTVVHRSRAPFPATS